MENLSQAPHVIRARAEGQARQVSRDSLMVALKDSYCGLFMAQTRTSGAEVWDLTRSQDQFALRSHTLANRPTPTAGSPGSGRGRGEQVRSR